MQDSLPTAVSDPCADADGADVRRADTRHILGFVYFTFICYLSIGLPLAVLPPYVHLRMGYSAVLAGLVISIQYIATLASRPWAGRISDRAGAKVSVLWGMGSLHGERRPAGGCGCAARRSLAQLFSPIASRLVLGVGESLGSTGSTLWGITSAGQEHTAKVISFNGISTYGAMALGAPLGVVIYQQWGLASIGLLTMADRRRQPGSRHAQEPGAGSSREHLPFSHVLGRVSPMAWAWRWAASATACWPPSSRSFT